MKKWITSVIALGFVAGSTSLGLAADIEMSGSVGMDDNLSIKGGINSPRSATVIADTSDNLTWESNSLVLVDNGTVRLPVPQQNITSNRAFTIIGVNNSTITAPAGRSVTGTTSLNGNSVNCVNTDNATWVCY